VKVTVVVVIWLDSVIPFFLNMLGAFARLEELHRCFFRASGQLVVSLKKKISTIEH
jgi:hypothetical protein